MPRARSGWAVATLMVAMLISTPGQPQAQSCDGGSGGMMTDLGFDHPGRSASLRDHAGPRFETEPRVRGVRGYGPAAGRLQDGDLLLAVDGQPITTPAGARRLSKIAAGERVRLSVRRGEELREVTITAGQRCIPHPPAPPHAPAPPRVSDAPPPPPNELMPEGWLGFTLECRDCGEDESTGAFHFRAPPVVVSVEPGSPAARAGLQAGDRLTHVDGVSLVSEEGWPRLQAILPGHEVRFTYTRGGRTHQASMRAVGREH